MFATPWLQQQPQLDDWIFAGQADSSGSLQTAAVVL
jgi:hypothetical protein